MQMSLVTAFIAWIGAGYTLAIVTAGATLLGATAGLLSPFTMLRRQSLLGDVMSHAALPGIATMFLATKTTHPLLLMVGGAIASILGVLCVVVVTHVTRLKRDTMLGIVLSVFFGAGVILMTVIQKKQIASQSILNNFLFGNASTLRLNDVMLAAILLCVVIAIIALWWKEWRLALFDADFCYAVGYSPLLLDIALTMLTACVVVVGLQSVGILLMSSLLIAPGAAARQWTYSLKPLVFLSLFFGAGAGASGALMSSVARGLPTGPVIVLFLTALVVVSLGARWYRERTGRASVKALPSHEGEAQ
jgi:manganese/zinc/iron transport system permease protein